MVDDGSVTPTDIDTPIDGEAVWATIRLAQVRSLPSIGRDIDVAEALDNTRAER